jgi:hypothetical protein
MRSFVIAAVALVLAAPSQAEIAARTENGFAVHQVADVSASPEDAWKVLIEPAGWWNGEHSFSGDAKNLTIDPRAGGCFCEVLPGEGESGFLHPRGGVEHMRVVFAERNKALRMTGALGPLQSEAVLGTLTITLKAVDGGTRITWDYVIAGYMRYKQEQIAPAVDKVIGEQLKRLADKLGPKAPSAQLTPAPGMEPGR